MANRFIRAALSAPVCLSLLLSGCGGVKLWPFGGETAQDRSRSPANATEYQCTGGKRFHVRYLDNGAAWLILAEREVRLDKVAAGGTRYSNGITVLDVSGNEATLAGAAAVSFAGCKAAGS